MDDEYGNRRPLKDLVAAGRFLLIVGEDGQDWCAATARVAAVNDLPVDVVQVGRLDGDLSTAARVGAVSRHYRERGLLVRPDRVVGWRSAGAAANAAATLAEALETILGRRVSVGG